MTWFRGTYAGLTLSCCACLSASSMPSACGAPVSSCAGFRQVAGSKSVDQRKYPTSLQLGTSSCADLSVIADPVFATVGARSDRRQYCLPAGACTSSTPARPPGTGPPRSPRPASARLTARRAPAHSGAMLPHMDSDPRNSILRDGLLAHMLAFEWSHIVRAPDVQQNLRC